MPVVMPSLASMETVKAVVCRDCVRPGHRVEMRAAPTRSGVSGKADQAAAEARHEIDRVRGRHLRRDDEVAFVFAVLVVHEDEHPALAGVLDDFLDGRQLPVDFVLVDDAQLIALHGSSAYCPVPATLPLTPALSQWRGSPVATVEKAFPLPLGEGQGEG